MNLSDLVELVRNERPEATVGAIRALVRDMDIGERLDGGFRSFSDADADVIVNAMPTRINPARANKRFVLLGEMEGGERVAWACRISYWSLMRMVREKVVPAVKVGGRYYFTKEMLQWIWDHRDGAQSASELRMVERMSKSYASVEEWRLGK